MKKHLVLLASSLMVSGLAFAQSVDFTDDFATAVNTPVDAVTATAPAPKTGPCSQINLTDAQKAQIKDAFGSFETAKVTLQANVKLARMAYYKAISTPATDVATAQAAAGAVTDAISRAISARLGFKTQVLFQIMTADQRIPALKCEAMHRKHRRHGRKGHNKGKGKGKTQQDEESIE